MRVNCKMYTNCGLQMFVLAPGRAHISWQRKIRQDKTRREEQPLLWNVDQRMCDQQIRQINQITGFMALKQLSQSQ